MSKVYVYTLNLEKGKKYVGTTTNLNRRMNEHLSEKGVSIHSIQQVSTIAYAKKVESIIYTKMKNYHGTSKVRKAGSK